MLPCHLSSVALLAGGDVPCLQLFAASSTGEYPVFLVIGRVTLFVLRNSDAVKQQPAQLSCAGSYCLLRCGKSVACRLWHDFTCNLW